MEDGAEESLPSLRCQLCGELFPTSTDLSKHLTDSPCGMSGGSTMSSTTSSGQVVTVSSEGRIVTVTSVPTIQLQEVVEVKVEEDPSSCQLSMTVDESAKDSPEDKTVDSLPSGSVLVAQSSKEETGGMSSSPLTVSLLTSVMPSQTSSDSHVLPAVAIPVSEVQSSVAHGSLFVTQDSGVLKLVSNEGRSVAVVSSVPSTLSTLGQGSKIDPHVTTISTAVSIPTEALLGQVAMDIHIPVHSQLIVNDYVESDVQKDKQSDIFSTDTKEKKEGPKDKASEAVLSVPEISWSFEDGPKTDMMQQQRKKKSKHKDVLGVQKFCCEDCGRTFSKSSNLFRHRHTHTGEKYICDVCNKHFTYKETLRIHKLSFHNESDPLCSTLPKCKFCHRLFSSISDLGIHLRTHTYDKPFVCQVCQKTFMSTNGLKRHQLIHTAEKEHECAVCMKRFLRKASLERHRIIHSEDKPFKCSHCYKTFADKFACASHEKLHNDDRAFGCQYCLKFFKTATGVRIHETIHTRSKTFACSKCIEKFGTSRDLKLHMGKHWKAEFNENMKLEANQCRECGANFTQRVTLRAHERTHRGEVPYHCQTCNKGFAYYSSWRRHVKMHKGEKPHVCRKCGKGFTKKLYLIRHEKGFCYGRQHQVRKDSTCIQTNETSKAENPVLETCSLCKSPPVSSKPSSLVASADDKVDRPANSASTQEIAMADRVTKVLNEMNSVSLKPFACELCGKMYKTNSSLQRHLRTHKNNKPFPCEICGKGYSRRPVLQEHKMMVHGIECKKAIFQCADCDKSYPSKKRLEIHCRMHTGERPHNCPICGKSFKETSNLKRHLQIHADTKPFKCVVCDRGFNDKGNMQKHEATHGIRGEEDRAGARSWTPFSCPVCGKMFKQLGYLRNHERMMHQTKETFSCQACDRTFSKAANLQAHVKSHTEKPFKCPHCSASYRKESKLQKHVSNCHDVRKCFVCGKCGKVLMTKASLKQHEDKHKGTNPYVCPICQNSFKNKVFLKKHQQVHGKEILFCEECDQAFLSKDVFEKHKKEGCCHRGSMNPPEKQSKPSTHRPARHSNSRKSRATIVKTEKNSSERSTVYVCDICNKTFDRKKLLTKHKKAHRKGEI